MSNWLDASSTSNKYRQMYIKGFLDVSGGNLTLRNNHLFVKAGDASLNGNLYVKNTAVLEKLVVNDLSLNGVLNFGSNSIPPTAIIGGIPGSSGSFNLDLSLTNRLFVSKDVSFNSNIYALNSNIANTSITKSLIVTHDVSINGNLNVGNIIYENGLSLNSKYASKNSPAFTGIPTAPTAGNVTANTQIATTAFVSNSVLNLISTAPTSLNTLGKLAIAVNSDPSFSHTVLSQLNTKVSISNPSFLGSATSPYFIATSTSSDTSFNGFLKVGKSISEGGVLLSSKYANIASPTFTGNVSIPTANINILKTISDASVNGNLYVKGNVTMDNIVDISGSLITHNNVNVYGIINQYTTTLDQGYIVNYNNISGNGDISANGIILQKSTNGQNSIIGISAGTSLTSGINNTILGYNTATSLTNGNNNIIIGSNANSSTSTISNEITLGNNSISVLRCQASSITSLSDLRDKTDIEEIPLGLNFIDKLHPVKFVWNTRDGSKKNSKDFGFIAQELKDAEDMVGMKVPNLINNNNPDKLEASYGTLIPIMVKAIKELSELTAKQQQEIELLKQLLNA
jgi:hypothetical protein